MKKIISILTILMYLGCNTSFADNEDLVNAGIGLAVGLVGGVLNAALGGESSSDKTSSKKPKRKTKSERRIEKEKKERISEITEEMPELFKQGNIEQAESMLTESVQLAQEVYGPDSLEVAEQRILLGQAYMRLKQYDKAKEVFTTAVQVAEPILGKDNPKLVTAYVNLTLIYHSEYNLSEAEHYGKLALAICKKKLGEDSPQALRLQERLQDIYKLQAKEEQQKRVQEEARRKAAEKELERAKARGEVLVFKGLHLGMDIDEACAVLNEKLGEDWVVEVDGNNFAIGSIWMGNFLVLAGPDKKVTQIGLGEGQIDGLFNAGGLDGKQFVQAFINSYNIKSMEPFTQEYFNGQYNDITYGWQYSSPHGYNLKIYQIYQEKVLLLKTIPKQSELQFD